MKSLAFQILFIVLTALTQAQTKTLIIKTQILCCRCMQCGTCGPNIYNYVTEDDGVKRFVLDVRANKIFIMYDSKKTTPEKIRNAINSAGYDADSNKAPFKAVCKLNSCCREKMLLSE